MANARGRLQVHEIESYRRSLAMADNLPRPEVERVLAECERLLIERVKVERILAELRPAWGGARRALNELHRVLGDRPPPGR
jgi:hypothetical protein